MKSSLCGTGIRAHYSWGRNKHARFPGVEFLHVCTLETIPRRGKENKVYHTTTVVHTFALFKNSEIPGLRSSAQIL